MCDRLLDRDRSRAGGASTRTAAFERSMPPARLRGRIPGNCIVQTSPLTASSMGCEHRATMMIAYRVPGSRTYLKTPGHREHEAVITLPRMASSRSMRVGAAACSSQRPPIVERHDDASQPRDWLDTVDLAHRGGIMESMTTCAPSPPLTRLDEMGTIPSPSGALLIEMTHLGSERPGNSGRNAHEGVSRFDDGLRSNAPAGVVRVRNRQTDSLQYKIKGVGPSSP